jgi:hypothetical protein
LDIIVKEEDIKREDKGNSGRKRRREHEKRKSKKMNSEGVPRQNEVKVNKSIQKY